MAAATPITFKLPALDPRVVEALHEITRLSLDGLTGSVVIHLQQGVPLSIETRTKRKLTREHD